MIVFTMEVNVTSACLYSASVIIRFLHSIDYQKKVKMSKSTLLHPKSAFNLPYKTLFYRFFRYHRKIQISETDCKTWKTCYFILQKNILGYFKAPQLSKCYHLPPGFLKVSCFVDFQHFTFSCTFFTVNIFLFQSIVFFFILQTFNIFQKMEKSGKKLLRVNLQNVILLKGIFTGVKT